MEDQLEQLKQLTKLLIEKFCLTPTKYINKLMSDDIYNNLNIIYDNVIEMKTDDNSNEIDFMEPFENLEDIFYEKIYDSDSVDIVCDNEIKEIMEYIEKFFIEVFNMSFTFI